MANKSLIVVDMQKGFMTNSNYKLLTKKINDLIKHSNYTKIYLTKFINADNSFYETKLKWFKLKSQKSQDFSIKVPQNAIIFEKMGYGLSFEQLNKLKELNQNSIDICGLQSDACVYAIALQLFDNDIFPNILVNYIATNPSREHIVKEILIHQFGSIDEKE